MLLNQRNNNPYNISLFRTSGKKQTHNRDLLHLFHQAWTLKKKWNYYDE